MKRIIGVLTLSVLAGCASTKQMDVARDDINGMIGRGITTFSDRGTGVVYDPVKSMHSYSALIGGFGGCDAVFLQFAKPSLDQFMVQNSYRDYTVKETLHRKTPPTNCTAYVQYIK